MAIALHAFTCLAEDQLSLILVGVQKLSDTEHLLTSLYNHDGEDIQYCKQPQVTRGVFKISRNSTNTYSAKEELL